MLGREGGAGALDFFEDGFAFRLPNVALGFKIAVCKIVVNRSDQVRDTCETAVTNAVDG